MNPFVVVEVRKEGKLMRARFSRIPCIGEQVTVLSGCYTVMTVEHRPYADGVLVQRDELAPEASITVVAL